jgi:putative membrane protein
MDIADRLLPRDSWNRWMLTVFLMLWVASCIRVPYPKYFWLQHVPTVAALVVLAAAQNRFEISRTSYTLILAFLALHLLGARYLYSYVPYDYWSERLLGFDISERFGFTRNHYDRLVHLFFGLLLVIPVRRSLRRFAGVDATWSAALAFSLILAASALYEVFEWLVAAKMAPDWAESYNGQQGDVWDAQRDMALAAVGAAAGLVIIGVTGLVRSSRAKSNEKLP